jgi:hypothetical protein
VLPSTAAEAGKDEFSVEDAVAGWLSATLLVPHVAATAPGALAAIAEPVSTERTSARQARMLRIRTFTIASEDREMVSGLFQDVT